MPAKGFLSVEQKQQLQNLLKQSDCATQYHPSSHTHNPNAHALTSPGQKDHCTGDICQ
jgi:hypothetical protein